MLTKYLTTRSRATADERGAVLVITVVVLSTLLIFAAYVIDEGIWFVHHSHLQTQADAAALAGAQNFQFPCTTGVNTEGTTDYKIATEVHQYDGTVSNAHNEQVSRTPTPVAESEYSPTQHNLISQLNQPKWINPSQSGDTGLSGSPCKDHVIDVKLSETNLPSFFPFGNPKFITAQARVSIEQQTSTAGMEPLAVAQSSPVAAKAYFVNEDAANKVLAESSLAVAPNGQEWTSATSTPVAINKTNATTAHIGVVIALSGNANYPKQAGALSTKCHEAFVQCFDESSTGPLLHIAGYSEAGTGSLTAPLARQVTLSKPSTPEEACSDGYFSNSTTNCKFAISARIDYGAESTNAKGVTITPVVAGTKSTTKLAYNTTSKEWTGTAKLPERSGSNVIGLLVECKKETGSPCQSGNTSHTIEGVQRIYAASSGHSGPITGAWVSEPKTKGPVPGNEGADSYEVCETQDGNSCTHELTVTIDVAGGLGNAAQCETKAACEANKAGFFDPEHKLKVEGNGGVIYECVPEEKPSTAEYRKHLAGGCPYGYKLNETTSEGFFSDPNCTAANPYDCISVGAKGNHKGAESGITERIETKPPAGTHFECSEWVSANSKEGKVPTILPTDSRLVEVFVIPYGAINEEGTPTGGLKAAPIQALATFYVTGFPGDTNECLEKGDPETPGFEVKGHFIKYVSLPPAGTGTGSCSETSFGTCIAILTK